MIEAPYIQEILSQAGVLKAALARYDFSSLHPLAKELQAGKFDRLVITGMGVSFSAAIPAWMVLAQHGLPVIHVEASELAHSVDRLVTSRTLLWVISQSGRTVEIVRLLESGKIKPAVLLATVNFPDSPLGKSAGIMLPIDAPQERTVSTRTYINSLASVQLTARALVGEPLDATRRELENAADALAVYLDDWKSHVARIDSLVGVPERLAVLGRGASMAAVSGAGFILGEASKFLALPMNAGQFRHGPMELISPALTALIFEGCPETAELNRHLAADILRYGGKAFLLSTAASPALPSLPMPIAAGAGLPLAEILPIQMMTIALANRAGLEPGKFFRTGKVTLQE